MKDAETRDIGEVGDGDVVGEMLFDVCENTPQSSVIQPVCDFIGDRTVLWRAWCANSVIVIGAALCKSLTPRICEADTISSNETIV